MLGSRILTVILITWLVVILSILAWSADESLVTFDGNGRLYEASLADDFEKNLVSQLTTLIAIDRKVAIHFENNDCTCQWVAASHIASVKKIAEEYGYTNQRFNLDNQQARQLFEYIPATPAIAIIDEKGALTYLGPYSTGMYCAAGNGLVERFIQGENSQRFGTAIPYDASGCYCAT